MRRVFPPAIAAVVLLALALAAIPAASASETTTTPTPTSSSVATAAPTKLAPARTLRVGRVARTYRVHTPQPPTHELMPLVVVLHGAGATSGEVERRYHWDPLADRNGFVVAYPQGLGLRWNDSASTSGPDDVGFLTKLVDTLEAKYTIDTARVYVTGISNGGIMTYRAACALGDRLAAIGPVAAWFPSCLPPTPLSIIHIHGLLDDQLLYAGGSGSPPVETGLAQWRMTDGCPANPETDAGAEVVERTWAPCADGTEVTLITLSHGQHEWPGATPKVGNEEVSNAIDATGTIWAFFQAHAR